jgi:hypothetical protein
MKKTIKALIDKLNQTSDGFLKGGFGNIKGGSTNDTCTGSNSSACTNNVDCTKTTNTAKQCSNKGQCYAL